MARKPFKVSYVGLREKVFWSNVQKISEGCWLWTAYHNPLGYGRFWNGKDTVQAHRFSYELNIGPVPSNMVMDHLCRNSRCVNPNHLEIVTQRVNVQRGNAGRHAILRGREQTHRKRSHKRTEKNTKVGSNGRKSCKICTRLLRSSWPSEINRPSQSKAAKAERKALRTEQAILREMDGEQH